MLNNLVSQILKIRLMNWNQIQMMKTKK